MVASPCRVNVKRLFAGLITASILAAGCSSSTGPAVDLPATGETLLSDRELNRHWFECVEAQGFTGTLDLDHFTGPQFSFSVTPERQALFLEVRDDCYDDLRERGLALDPSMAPSEADLRARYPDLLRSHECLREIGIDVAVPPSLSAYLDGGGRWLPWDAVDPREISTERLEEIFRTCPQ